MAKHIESYQLTYSDEYVPGTYFAKLTVDADTAVSLGYWGNEIDTREVTLYIHEDSGLVTNDPGRFVNWIDGLVRAR